MKNYVYVFVYNETDIQTINMHLKWEKYPYDPQWCSTWGDPCIYSKEMKKKNLLFLGHQGPTLSFTNYFMG